MTRSRILRWAAAVAALVSGLVLTACATTITEAQQGTAFRNLLVAQGFKDVGKPEWENDPETKTRKVNGRRVTRTSTERVVEITARTSGCTAEFEQKRNPNGTETNYILDEFQGVSGKEIDVDEGTEVGNLTPDQVSKYISDRPDVFKFCYKK